MKPCDTLTRREREVTDLITLGYTNSQIGQRLHVTEMVVKNYVRNILDKLGMDSRLQVALWRLKHAHTQSA